MPQPSTTITRRHLRRARREREQRRRKRRFYLLTAGLVFVNVVFFTTVMLVSDDAEQPRCLEMVEKEDKETCVRWEVNKTHRSTVINQPEE